jgi:hypothetical protein
MNYLDLKLSFTSQTTFDQFAEDICPDKIADLAGRSYGINSAGNVQALNYSTTLHRQFAWRLYCHKINHGNTDNFVFETTLRELRRFLYELKSKYPNDNKYDNINAIIMKYYWQAK